MLDAYQKYGEDAPKFLKAALPKDQYDHIFGTADFQQEVNKAPPPAATHGTGLVGWTGQQQAQQAGDQQFRTVKGIKPMADLAALTDFYKGKKGTLADTANVANQSLSEADRLQSGYAGDTARLLRRSRGIEETAKQFGKGREDIIRRDSAKGLQAANDTSSADLIASGLGSSTLLGNAKAANNRTYGDLQNNALTSLGESQTDRLMQAQTGTLGIDTARSAGGTALGQDLLGTRNNLRNAPINAQTNAFSGATWNPFLQSGASQYYPGLSPGGIAASSFGQSTAGMAGILSGMFAGRTNSASTGSPSGMWSGSSAADFNRIKGY